MKEQHLDEAIKIKGEINHLMNCKSDVETNLWTICKIGQNDEHHYAGTALGASEDIMRKIARDALLADIQNQIVSRRKHLRGLGIEMDGDDQGVNAPKAALQIETLKDAA